LTPFRAIGEEHEQAIRDHWGFAKSETRTQAERQAVADRIVREQSTRPHALEETGLVGWSDRHALGVRQVAPMPTTGN